MNCLRSLLRVVRAAALALSCSAILCANLFAQQKTDAAPERGGATDYTLAYAIVLLGIGLGLMVVLRTSNRRERERPEGYVQKDILKED